MEKYGLMNRRLNLMRGVGPLTSVTCNNPPLQDYKLTLPQELGYTKA
jgi:hypothetical protein